MATPWTKDQDKQLLALYASKTPTNEIARVLGRQNSSVRSRLVALERQRSKQPGKRRRACLCCGRSFESQGPHNRLCDPCRLKSRDLSPYAH